MTNYLLRWPKSFRGPMMGWRSIFFISAIILGLVLCLEYIYQYIGGEKLGELDAASPSSISKLSEQVESLQQQVTHLQRRFVVQLNFLSDMYLVCRQLFDISCICTLIGSGWSPSSPSGSIEEIITSARRAMKKTRTR